MAYLRNYRAFDPAEEWLTLAEVRQLTTLCNSTIYHKCGAGSFPIPARLSARATRWCKREILEWIESLPRNGAEADAAFPGYANQGKKKTKKDEAK